MTDYSVAPFYDSLLEPFISGLRRIANHRWPPRPGQTVLDIGCGTGTHLAELLKAGCRVHGIDASEAMVSQARRKLGIHADLHTADARSLPFGDGTFDLVTSTLVLHELRSETRETILREAARVLRPDGRILLIDFHPGPYPFPFGWLRRSMIVGIELLAGCEHFSNHRRFLHSGGLPALAARVDLAEVDRMIVGKGTLALLLLARSPRS